MGLTQLQLPVEMVGLVISSLVFSLFLVSWRLPNYVVCSLSLTWFCSCAVLFQYRRPTSAICFHHSCLHRHASCFGRVRNLLERPCPAEAFTICTAAQCCTERC